MRPRSAAIACLLVIVAACPAATAYVGDDNDLAVYITYPAGSYDVGSDVIITVTTFKDAQYYDPAQVELSVGETARWIGLTKEDIGKYKGVATIQLADLGRSGAMILAAQATDIGGRNPPVAYDYAYVDTLVGTSFTVSVRVPDTRDSVPVPGQDVDFVVGVDFRAAPVDPDAGTLEVYYTDQADYRTDVEVTRIGTGRFQGRLTVPPALRESARYTLTAEANYTKDARVYESSGGYEVYVDFLDVWAHIRSVTPAQTVLEMNVLDANGTAVAGANVSLDYIYYDDGHAEHKVPLSRTTDPSGEASFTLDYVDLGMEASSVIVDGRAKSGSITQLFTGVVQVREPVEYAPGTGTGFETEVLTKGPLVPGASVTVEVQATWDALPLVSKLVYLYVGDDHAIVRFGSATTDAQGKFSFPLNVPTLLPGQVTRHITLECQTDTVAGWRYSANGIQIGELPAGRLLDDLVDPQTTMVVSPFSVGDMATVTVDNPAADGVDENAYVLWLVGNSSDRSTRPNLEWESWDPAVIPTFGLVPCIWTDGKYVGTFRCPDFLNTSSRLFMYGLITFTDKGDLYGAAKVAKQDGIYPLPPNPAPTAAFISPVAGTRYGGVLVVRGTASDDKSVERVEIRLDGGAWLTVTGTTSWNYDLDTRPLAGGNHTLELRSYDGQKYSAVTSVEFVVDQSVGKKKGSPGLGAVVAVGALAVAAAAMFTAARRRGG